MFVRCLYWIVTREPSICLFTQISTGVLIFRFWRDTMNYTCTVYNYPWNNLLPGPQRSSVQPECCLAEQELFTLPEHLLSPPIFSGVHVAQSCLFSVFCLVLSFCPIYFYHSIVCPSLNYGFWLPPLVPAKFSELLSLMQFIHSWKHRQYDVVCPQYNCLMYIYIENC